jgi:hypothetical protein
MTDEAETARKHWQDRLDRFRNDGSCESDLLNTLLSRARLETTISTLTDRLGVMRAALKDMVNIAQLEWDFPGAHPARSAALDHARAAIHRTNHE